MKHRVSSWARRMLACVVCSVMAVGMVWAERVSQEDAALVANHFMNVASSSSSIKKSPAKRMVLKKAAKAEENQYYVYENADGEGWVMVAANDVVRPILAYSNTGTFRTEEMPSNIQRWLVKYDRFIVQLEKDGVTAGEETSAEWKSLRKGARKAKGDAVVGPLIQTQWDQDAPYNDLCPGSGKTKAYTGCVATAMAQVMNYWKWPVKGTGSRTYQPIQQKYDSNGNITGTYIVYEGKLTANFGATTYDWANMKKKHYTSDTQAQKTAISTLMYHCGVATDMMYGGDDEDGSGTFTVNYADWDWSDSEGECAQNALYMFFGYKKAIGYMRDGYSNIYKKWSDTDWENMIKTELDKKRPIMYAGAGDGGGHSFVCDGYDDAGYFHFNWGWSGSNDGYYLLSKLTPGSGGAGGGSYDFSEDQDVIIGIEPNITGHTVVVNGTGCTIAPSAQVAENSKELTATITPTDETYDFTSLTVKLGSTTLTKNTHYTLSSDNKTLTVKASAITGDAANDLTITAVWTKNRYKYELLGENCAPEVDEGMLAKNAALNLTITPNSGYTLADAACWDVEMGGVALTYGKGFTYNANTGAFAIAQITGDVAILAYGGKAVTWLANGEQFARNIALSDKLTLPANEPEGCDGKVFVGWTATADYEHASVAPTKVKDGDAANATTYYAVFATKGESGASVTNTYTFTSNKWEESTNTWTGTSNGNQYNDANQGVQVTTGTTGAGAKTTQSFNNVTKVVVKYCTNASKGAGSIDVTIGSTKVSQDVISTGGTSLRDLEFAFDGASGAATLVVNCTTNSIYVNSITITSGGGASYSDYTTSCTPPCVGELTGITIDTNDAQKEFTEGETFNYTGVVVTANYDGCDSKIVVPTSVSTPDMSTIGQQTVTVTYEGKTATYEITISALPTYTIRFYNNGALVGTAQSVKQGQQPNVPATPSACEGYTFGGWLDAALTDDVTEKPSYVTNFTATKNQDYFAAYSYTEEGEGGGATEVADELTRATTGVTGTNYSNWSGKTVNSDAVYAGNSAGGNDAIQLRSNNSNSGIVTTTSGGKITKVTVSWNNNTSGRTLDIYGKTTAYSSASDLYGSNAGTKLGSIASDSQTELVIDGDYSYVGVRSNSGAMYLDAITFTWSADGGSSNTTYYTTSPSCEACSAAVTVSKGETENGSFSLDYSGELSTCGGAVTITVTASPADGYRFKEITQTGMTEGVTIDQTAKTVTYAKKSEGASTISVIFEAKPKYTIRFYNNGTLIGTAQSVVEGQKAEVPATPTPECKEYTFVGWWTEALGTENTEKKTWVSDFTATKNQDYYAIYSKTVENGEPSTDYQKISSMDELTDGNYVLTGNNAYAMKGELYNTYYLATTSVSPSANKISDPAASIIWEISREGNNVSFYNAAAGKYVYLYQAGTYYDLGLQNTADEFKASVNNGNWTFESNTYSGKYLIYMIYKSTAHEFAAGSSTSTTLQLYKQADGQTVYYTSVEACTSTAVETVETNEPVAVKAIINGQIVIIRGEAVYTLTGARVQ